MAAMTIDEARNHIGDGVVCGTGHSVPETGVITGVTATQVLVRHHGDNGVRAHDPADLELLSAG